MQFLVAPLIRKLERFAPLADKERRALGALRCTVRPFAAHEDLVREGRPVEGINLVLGGFACRYKLLPDGRRQIVGFCVPGDMCDLRVYLLRRMDHSIVAMSPVNAALIEEGDLDALFEAHPRLSRAFWWSSMVEEAITREWLVNVGHRTAFERLAHLFCELHLRLQTVGLAQEHECDVPLTQTELADTLALSAVHVNRTLMDMRRSGMVTFQNKHLTIHDHGSLRNAAGFNPAYLYLDAERPSAAKPAVPIDA